MILTSVRNLLATVTLRQHDHATAMALEQVHIGIHTSGSSRAHGAASHALRSLGRTGVVDGMVFDVLRQVFATVQTFFQLGVCDVTAYDNGSCLLYTSPSPRDTR
mgnify:CR=1 FL=1